MTHRTRSRGLVILFVVAALGWPALSLAGVNKKQALKVAGEQMDVLTAKYGGTWRVIGPLEPVPNEGYPVRVVRTDGRRHIGKVSEVNLAIFPRGVVQEQSTQAGAVVRAGRCIGGVCRKIWNHPLVQDVRRSPEVATLVATVGANYLAQQFGIPMETALLGTGAIATIALTGITASSRNRLRRAVGEIARDMARETSPQEEYQEVYAARGFVLEAAMDMDMPKGVVEMPMRGIEQPQRQRESPDERERRIAELMLKKLKL